MAAKKKRRKSHPQTAAQRPDITRIQAVSRSRPKQWLVDNKHLIKPLAKVVGVILVIIIIVVGIVELVTR